MRGVQGQSMRGGQGRLMEGMRYSNADDTFWIYGTLVQR